MNKLLNTARTLQKNRKKGFTLVELIVVIVIIAILVAALTPAVLGVINRANRSADEADARSVMMAASVAALAQNPPGRPAADDDGVAAMRAAFGVAATESTGIFPGTYDVFFNGPIATGVQIYEGGRTGVTESTRFGIGNPSGPRLRVVINLDGSVGAVTHQP